MKKILVANRGEIAIRVMKSAREMGIKTVAVYSEADRNALHVRYADEAIFLGPPPSAQSYLLGDKIIEEAKKLGVDGIHPGYGFLSENADFARKVKEAGLIFIGPSAESMEVMGSKIGAKQAVKKFGVPMVPGIDYAISDVAEAKKIANDIGYPVLIKASAGGGGKGMRTVENEAELEQQMTMAINEATASFGDGSVFIEKFVGSPKHIEIQILGDQHGNIVHLFERECSIQRRHQKLIEEAPSSCLTPEIREEMGQAAVNVAKACNYFSAGTVEFLVDEKLNFYFLEMNTRLQVEHPVTELITGLDLVKEQIKVAMGEKLSFSQEDLDITGHAIELRVCAEDPANNFLPDIGKLERYQLPEGVGVRVDNGFEEGMDIPIYYDPMMSKLVAYGKDRTEAIDRLLRAIKDYHISGIETTLPFGTFALQHPKFVEGDFDTHFINKYYTPDKLYPTTDDTATVAAIAAHLANTEKKGSQTTGNDGKQHEAANKWKQNRRVLR
jgi:acetyl-CoA carboxylase biotin carboxylase subunit